MGLITKNLEIAGDKGTTRVSALFDTGASATFIRKSIAQDIATILKMPRPWIFTLGDDKSSIRADENTAIHITIKDCTIIQQVFPIDHLAEELIIGADTLQRWKIKLDPETEDVIIDKKVTELKLI